MPRLLALMRLHDGQRRAGRERRVNDHAKGHLVAGGHTASPHPLDRGQGSAKPQRTRKARHLRPGKSTVLAASMPELLATRAVQSQRAYASFATAPRHAHFIQHLGRPASLLACCWHAAYASSHLFPLAYLALPESQQQHPTHA